MGKFWPSPEKNDQVPQNHKKVQYVENYTFQHGAPVSKKAL